MDIQANYPPRAICQVALSPLRIKADHVLFYLFSGYCGVGYIFNHFLLCEAFWVGVVSAFAFYCTINGRWEFTVYGEFFFVCLRGVWWWSVMWPECLGPGLRVFQSVSNSILVFAQVITYQDQLISRLIHEAIGVRFAIGAGYTEIMNRWFISFTDPVCLCGL